MQKNLVWLGSNLIMAKMGNDEFTVHSISSATMNYFPDKTLALFRNFCIEEIALDGDWRVALRNNFPNEIKQC